MTAQQAAAQRTDASGRVRVESLVTSGTFSLDGVRLTALHTPGH